ncbi:hypothetical protein F4809DRAFT_145423 [Biscogniauxia mediterranea]|nr:hypothetical protein F4809DRAFT_145423 [Biscogniauxia mediterranea]
MEQAEPSSHARYPSHHEHMRARARHHSHHTTRHHIGGGGQHQGHHGDLSPPCHGCGGGGGGGGDGDGGGEGGEGGGVGGGGQGMRAPIVMGMLPDRYREAFSAHERAVFVEENRQRERRRTAVEKGVLLRGPWYVRIEYWAGIVGICAFLHQLFLTYVSPRFEKSD